MNQSSQLRVQNGFLILPWILSRAVTYLYASPFPRSIWALASLNRSENRSAIAISIPLLKISRELSLYVAWYCCIIEAIILSPLELDPDRVWLQYVASCLLAAAYLHFLANAMMFYGLKVAFRKSIDGVEISAASNLAHTPGVADDWRRPTGCVKIFEAVIVSAYSEGLEPVHNTSQCSQPTRRPGVSRRQWSRLATVHASSSWAISVISSIRNSFISIAVMDEVIPRAILRCWSGSVWNIQERKWQCRGIWCR